MIAALIAHNGHVAPHGDTGELVGAALLLAGAAMLLWRSRASAPTRAAPRGHPGPERPGRGRC